MNNKISAIIISKNEEEMIADCIKSVSFCDEIIVVDSGSTDRTIEIAKELKVKVFSYKTSDFSSLRNFGLEKATGDWILYIDCDERINENLQKNIKIAIFKENNETTAYKLTRKNFYLGNHEWPKKEELERLFKKKSLKGWKGQLHESPIYTGEIGKLDGFLLHYSHRSLSAMLSKTMEWSEIEANLRLKANHPKMTLWRFPKIMISTFGEYFFKQGGWKIGTTGLIESIYQSFSIFITYAKLWELQNKK